MFTVCMQSLFGMKQKYFNQVFFCFLWCVKHQFYYDYFIYLNLLIVSLAYCFCTWMFFLWLHSYTTFWDKELKDLSEKTFLRLSVQSSTYEGGWLQQDKPYLILKCKILMILLWSEIQALLKDLNSFACFSLNSSSHRLGLNLKYCF